MKRRAADKDIAQRLYERIMPHGNETICAYCGDISDTWDHVLPLSWAAAHIARTGHVSKAAARLLILVPCCRNCNNLGGSRVFLSAEEKAGYIKGKIREKNKNLLNEIDWDEEELSELGPNLHSFIKSFESRRHAVLARLEWTARDLDERIQRART